MLASVVEQLQLLFQQPQRARAGAPEGDAGADRDEAIRERQQHRPQPRDVLPCAGVPCDLGQGRHRRQPIAVARQVVRRRQGACQGLARGVPPLLQPQPRERRRPQRLLRIRATGGEVALFDAVAAVLHPADHAQSRHIEREGLRARLPCAPVVLLDLLFGQIHDAVEDRAQAGVPISGRLVSLGACIGAALREQCAVERARVPLLEEPAEKSRPGIVASAVLAHCGCRPHGRPHARSRPSPPHTAKLPPAPEPPAPRLSLCSHNLP